jgi:oxygen-dependent protoporphyrinogen oxidase
MHEWAEEHFEDDDDTLRRLILISAEKIMPGISDTVDFTRIIRWGNIVVYSRPGIYRDLGEFMKKRPKNTRIQLGGTYFSSSDICTAVTSGERAVRELLPVVRAEAASRRLSSKKA